MDKIKVGFEVTDNWKRGDFREFIQSLIKDNCNYEVYIISNDDISSYIYSIGEELSLPSSRVIVVNFTVDKVQAIINNKIDIYFDNLQYVVMNIQETTDCEAILVTGLPNKYYAKPTYQVEFIRIVNMLRDGKDQSGEELKIC
jgi:hypothetical protein